MRIGVIASMKKGLDHFIYRELMSFSRLDHSITLFPTKYGRGLYDARREWTLCLWHPLIVALLQPFFFLRSPLNYSRLLLESLSCGALVDMALAWYFAPKMHDVDVIYATFGDHKLFVGYFCKQITHKPLVVTIHAYELYRNPNPVLFARSLQSCDRIITVTSYNQELLACQYQIPPSKIDVVRISVDVDEFKSVDKFVVLIVSFFLERKGHEILFKAVKELAQDDIEVWVVGGPGDEMEPPVDVRRMAEELRIQSQVAFFGPLSGAALKAVYRSCDVFCLPCRRDSTGISEGFPTVLAEAMAFGKPIITTRHVEIPRIVDEMLIEENDIAGLAHALRQLYQSASLRTNLGTKNRLRAEELFSVRNAEETARILVELTQQRQGP